MRCNCPVGTRFQTYENTEALPAPGWSSKETITVDKCIVNEIKYLWELGIKTAGSCCGHNLGAPMINPLNDEDGARMSNMGYVVILVATGAFVAKPKSIDYPLLEWILELSPGRLPMEGIV